MLPGQKAIEKLAEPALQPMVQTAQQPLTQPTAARGEMAQQQIQIAEQMDRSAVEQLAKRVAALEAGQNGASHNDDADLQIQVQAETDQVKAQNTAVKDEETQIQEIIKRL